METKYGHIYSIAEMEYYLNQLVKHNGLRNSGSVMASAPDRFKESKPDTKPLFMPIKPSFKWYLISYKHQFGMFK